MILLCFLLITTHQGALQAAITDGITIRHPCCNVHDCKTLLGSQYDQFCPEHQAMGYKCCCVVTDCIQEVNGHHQTCSVKPHTAMFQLCHQLEHLKIYHAPNEASTIGNNVSSSFVLGEIVKVELNTHPSKPDMGNCEDLGLLWEVENSQQGTLCCYMWCNPWAGNYVWVQRSQWSMCMYHFCFVL